MANLQKTARGAVRAYTRHVTDCSHKADSNYNDCRCAKWLYVNRDGKRTRYSLSTPSWAEAQRIAADTLDAMHPEIEASRKEKSEKKKSLMSVRDACDLWIERTEREFGRSVLDQYRSLSNSLCRWASSHGVVNVQDITPLQMSRWYSGGDWKDYAETTRYQRWGVLRSIFNYWREIGVLQVSPVQAIRAIKVKGSHVQGPYTDQQIAAVLAAIPGTAPLNIAAEERPIYAIRLTTFVNLMLSTGADLSDAILYDPQNLHEVQIENGTVFVYRYKRRKTGVEAVIPIESWLVDDLREVPPLKKNRAGLPFRTDTEADLRWDVRVWSDRVDRAIKAAGVNWVELPGRDPQGRALRKRANVKMLRHTFAVRQLKAGQRPEDVARMMGHVNTEMIRKHYAPWVADLDLAQITRVISVRAAR